MQDTVAVGILAGGGGRRLGGADKALVEVADRPLLAHLLDVLRPQAMRFALSANGDLHRFDEFGIPVVPDTIPGVGPLAGIAALARHFTMSHSGGVRHLVTVPVDVPRPPADLIARLVSAREAAVGYQQAEVAVARTGGRCHWTVACWPVSSARRLHTMIEAGGVRRVEDAVVEIGFVPVDFEDETRFTNVNAPQDLQIFRDLLAIN